MLRACYGRLDPLEMQWPFSSMQRRVLIVDDEADVGRLLSFALAEAGFETEVATTGEQALEIAAQLRPHVVILDLMLPGLSKFEVCRRLREMPAVGDAGIIMLTARGDEYDRVAGLEVGADDDVVKPFSVREVLLRVQALVKRAVTGPRGHGTRRDPRFPSTSPRWWEHPHPISARLACGDASFTSPDATRRSPV